MHDRAYENSQLKEFLALLKVRLPRDIDSYYMGLIKPQLSFSEFSYYSVYRSIGLITENTILNEINLGRYEVIKKIIDYIKLQL